LQIKRNNKERVKIETASFTKNEKNEEDGHAVVMLLLHIVSVGQRSDGGCRQQRRTRNCRRIGGIDNSSV